MQALTSSQVAVRLLAHGYVWGWAMGDHDQPPKEPRDKPEERRRLLVEWAKIVLLVIVAWVVIATIMALAYFIGRSLWG